MKVSGEDGRTDVCHFGSGVVNSGSKTEVRAALLYWFHLAPSYRFRGQLPGRVS